MLGIHRYGGWVLAVAALFCLTGCPPKPEGGKVAAPPPRQLPTYEQIAAGYNSRLQRVDRLWSRVTVEVRWQDRKGKDHHEQGEGNLIMVLPEQIALSVGKLGNTMFWAGADGKDYWLLDLRDDQKAYVGSEGLAGKGMPGTLPVRPGDLPLLLGLLPLPAQSGPGAKVAWAGDGFLVTTPTTAAAATVDGPPDPARTRVVVDPVSLQPRRITLLNQAGVVQMSAELSDFRAMEVEGTAPGGYPQLPTRIKVTTKDGKSNMALHLSALTNRAEKFKPEIFKLDYLLQALKIKPAQVVDVDVEAAGG